MYKFYPEMLEAATLPPKDLVASAWLEHIPFAFAATALLKPQIFVELGTHNGASFFAFCQAIEHFGLPTTAYAIDTWQGDEHAGSYGEEVYAGVQERNRKYSHFAYLLRQTFDDAVSYFQDGQIDLLHIDGLHTLEAVKHDFETWLPKLSDRGVVLLHDTQVRERSFGVWQLLEQLSKKYETFNFRHGFGLGIVLVGTQVPEDFRQFVEALRSDVSLSKFFEQLGVQVRSRFNLQRDHAELIDQINKEHSEIQALRSSVSYRVGRIMTWPLRKILRRT